MTIVVAALYKFVVLPDYKDIQQKLIILGKKNKLKGSLLLAQEGINGTVAGRRDSIDILKKFLEADTRFHELEYKESFAEENPFYRYKVRLKKEIVTLGEPTVNPVLRVGHYVDPEHWNDLIKDPDVIVIDTRNDYEVQMGAFKRALDPKTKSFREFPKFLRTHLKNKKDLKFALYCTGGIRCEKATSLMLDEGFKNVYHLKGGILKYLETTPLEKTLWEGECFVFDHRVGVKHGLEVGEYDLCHGCRNPISSRDLESPLYEKGVSCPQCYDTTSSLKKERARARHKQVLLAKSRGKTHIGMSDSFYTLSPQEEKPL